MIVAAWDDVVAINGGVIRSQQLYVSGGLEHAGNVIGA